MSVMKAAPILAGIAVFAISSYMTLRAATPTPQGIKRIDLQRHDLSIPGREVIQAIVEIAPGVLAPRHSHPGEEIIYVLEGSLEYEVEGKPLLVPASPQ